MGKFRFIYWEANNPDVLASLDTNEMKKLIANPYDSQNWAIQSMVQFVNGGANWLAVFNEKGLYVGGSGIYEGDEGYGGTGQPVIATRPTWVGVSCKGQGVGTLIAAHAASIAVARGEEMHINTTEDSESFWIGKLGGEKTGYAWCEFKGEALEKLAGKVKDSVLERNVAAFPIILAPATKEKAPVFIEGM